MSLLAALLAANMASLPLKVSCLLSVGRADGSILSH